MLAVIVCDAYATNKNNNDSTREYAGGALVSLNNGETIFERQIRLLGDCGVRRFSVFDGGHRARLEPLTRQKAFSAFTFTWTEEPVFDAKIGIFSVCDPDRSVTQDTVILTGGLVFNRESMRGFLKEGHGPLFAVKALQHASGAAFIVQTSEDGHIRAAGPPVGEPDEDCFALWPLCVLKKGNNSVEKARAAVWDGLLQDVQSKDDAKKISTHMVRSDMMEQRVLSGVYSMLELEQLLARSGMQKPLIVTDAWRRSRRLKAYLDDWLEYAVFETASDTPDYRDVLQGARRFAEEGCDGIISLGGDGAADMAKLIRLFSRLPDPEDYYHPKVRLTDVKHIAVPDGSGTGVEAIPAAVLTKDGEQERIVCPAFLPDYVLLEPKMMDMLGAELKKSTVLDVLCRAIDSLWAVHSDHISLETAKESLTAVLDDCVACLDGDMPATANVMRAQVRCAKAAYISGKTAGYAAGCELSNLYSIPRGYAAALVAPYFWDYYARNLPKSHTHAGRKKSAAALHTIKEILGCKTNYEIIEILSFLASHFFRMDLPNVSGQELNRLTELLQEDVHGDAPVSMDVGEVRDVLQKAFAREELWRRTALPRRPGNIRDWQEFLVYWQSCLENSVLGESRRTGMDLLDETVRICEENGLEYFLSYDTLLGAVHCSGFLPGHDEIRISMPRVDWERFIAIAGEQMQPGYTIHYSGNDPYCWFDCIRVCKKGTYLERKKDRLFYSGERGVYISIYPVDSLKHGRGPVISLRYKICRGLIGIIQCRLNPNSKSLRFRGRLILRLSRVFRLRRLHAMRHRVLSRRRKGSFVLLGCRYALEREAISRKQIYPLAKLEFESRQYNVPGKWSAVLKQLYGGCEKDPPESETVSPRILRAAFKPGETVALFNVKVLKARSPQRGGLSFLGRARQGMRGIFVRIKKLLHRTGTRIGGFFRTKGIIVSRKSRVLASYRNKYAGQRCFLIGNGPSLRAEDLDRLQGEITFGCNLIYKIFEQTSWHPTFYCVSDSTISRAHSRDILDNIEHSQLMVRDFAYRYMHVRPWDAVRLPSISVDWYKVRGNVLAYHYISHATVMSMMMELAFYMGFKEIYLIGVDGTSASAKGGHFTDSYFSKELKAYADQIKKRVIEDYDPRVRAAYLQERSLEIYTQLRKYAEKHGIKIYNATRGGVIEVFDRADFDEVLETEKKDLKQ